MISKDTSPEIAELQRKMLLRHTGEERFMMGIRMFDAVRTMVLASLPEGITDEERKKMIFKRFYSDSACSMPPMT